MWIKNDQDRALVKDLARDVVAAVAPTKLKNFDIFADDYLENPVLPSSRAIERDTPLGADLTDPALIVQIAVAAANAGIAVLVEAFKDAIKDELIDTWIKPALHKLLRKQQAQPGDALDVKRDASGTPQVVIINIHVHGVLITPNVEVRLLQLAISNAIKELEPSAETDAIVARIVDRMTGDDRD